MGLTSASGRTFVAIDIPSAHGSRIAGVRSEIEHARWTNPAQYHVTLRFIGKTSAESLALVRDELAAIRSNSFELTLAEFGVFPATGAQRPPRTLWIRPLESPGLIALRAGVEAAVARSTGVSDDKPFRPHVTLARFRKPPRPGEVTGWLDRKKSFAPEVFRVERFRLYSSELNPDGAVHTVLATYDLL